MLDIVEPLVGPDIALWTSHFISKDPFTGRATPWHEDSRLLERPASTPTTTSSPSGWPSGPSNRTNGCMRVVPGSHLEGGFHDNYVPTDMSVQTFHAEIPDVDESTGGRLRARARRVLAARRPDRARRQAQHQRRVRRTGYTMRYFPASVKMQPVEQNEGWKIWLARGKDPAGNTYENA